MYNNFSGVFVRAFPKRRPNFPIIPFTAVALCDNQASMRSDYEYYDKPKKRWADKSGSFDSEA